MLNTIKSAWYFKEPLSSAKLASTRDIVLKSFYSGTTSNTNEYVSNTALKGSVNESDFSIQCMDWRFIRLDFRGQFVNQILPSVWDWRIVSVTTLVHIA